MYKRGPVKKVTLQMNFATMTVTKWSLPIPRLQRKRSCRQPLVMELRKITTLQEDLDSLIFLLLMPSWGSNNTEKVNSTWTEATCICLHLPPVLRWSLDCTNTPGFSKGCGTGLEEWESLRMIHYWKSVYNSFDLGCLVDVFVTKQPWHEINFGIAFNYHNYNCSIIF